MLSQKTLVVCVFVIIVIITIIIITIKGFNGFGIALPRQSTAFSLYQYRIGYNTECSFSIIVVVIIISYQIISVVADDFNQLTQSLSITN